jgi:hypothetical protein
LYTAELVRQIACLPKSTNDGHPRNWLGRRGTSRVNVFSVCERAGDSDWCRIHMRYSNDHLSVSFVRTNLDPRQTEKEIPFTWKRGQPSMISHREEPARIRNAERRAAAATREKLCPCCNHGPVIGPEDQTGSSASVSTAGIGGPSPFAPIVRRLFRVRCRANSQTRVPLRIPSANP